MACSLICGKDQGAKKKKKKWEEHHKKIDKEEEMGMWLSDREHDSQVEDLGSIPSTTSMKNCQAHTHWIVRQSLGMWELWPKGLGTHLR